MRSGFPSLNKNAINVSVKNKTNVKAKHTCAFSLSVKFPVISIPNDIIKFVDEMC